MIDPDRQYRAVPSVFLDVPAMVAAFDREDLPAVQRIVNAHNPGDVIAVLTQLLANEVKARGVTVQDWVDYQTMITLNALRGEQFGGGTDV